MFGRIFFAPDELWEFVAAERRPLLKNVEPIARRSTNFRRVSFMSEYYNEDNDEGIFR